MRYPRNSKSEFQIDHQKRKYVQAHVFYELLIIFFKSERGKMSMISWTQLLLGIFDKKKSCTASRMRTLFVTRAVPDEELVNRLWSPSRPFLLEEGEGERERKILVEMRATHRHKHAITKKLAHDTNSRLFDLPFRNFHVRFFLRIDRARDLALPVKRIRDSYKSVRDVDEEADNGKDTYSSQSCCALAVRDLRGFDLGAI